MNRNIQLVIILLILLASCARSRPEARDQEYRLNDNGDTIYIYHKKDGTLLSEVTIKNGLRNGFSWVYYPNGKVKKMITYKYDLKQGLSEWYYENGQLFQQTPYLNDKIHGVRKKYHKDGWLMAEIPYENGEPIPGTREYISSGELINDYPEILFFTSDDRATKGIYTIRMYLSNKKREVFFYYYKDINGKKTKIGMPTKYNGIADFNIKIHPGQPLPEQVEVFAQFETTRKNPYVTSGVYYHEEE